MNTRTLAERLRWHVYTACTSNVSPSGQAAAARDPPRDGSAATKSGSRPIPAPPIRTCLSDSRGYATLSRCGWAGAAQGRARPGARAPRGHGKARGSHRSPQGTCMGWDGETAMTMASAAKWQSGWERAEEGCGEAHGPGIGPITWGIMKKLRELFAYGVAAELNGCAGCVDILAEIRFPQPARRRRHPRPGARRSLHPECDRDGAHLPGARDRDPVRRGHAQKDVVGEWEPIPEGEARTGIVLNGRRWVNGLTWAGVVLDGVTRKATTKNRCDDGCTTSRSARTCSRSPGMSCPSIVSSADRR